MDQIAEAIRPVLQEIEEGSALSSAWQLITPRTLPSKRLGAVPRRVVRLGIALASKPKASIRDDR
jgi:hypothetical protein